MARTKQTARKSGPSRLVPARIREDTNRLLQLMGYPAHIQGDVDGTTATADWSAVTERLKSHPEESNVAVISEVNTNGWVTSYAKYPLLLALANVTTPLTKEALDAFLMACPEVATNPRSTAMRVALKNPANADRSDIIDTLKEANPHLCGRQRTRTFQLMGYGEEIGTDENRSHRAYVSYPFVQREPGTQAIQVDWEALENHLRAHPEEAKIVCPETDGGYKGMVFPLEAALQFRQYPTPIVAPRANPYQQFPVPLSTVQLLLRLAPEAVQARDSSALYLACVGGIENPEIIRAILQANPALASSTGYYIDTLADLGLPIHEAVCLRCAEHVVPDLLAAYPESIASQLGKYDKTPVHRAAEQRHVSTNVLRILLEAAQRYCPTNADSPRFSSGGPLLMGGEEGGDNALTNVIGTASFEKENWESGRDTRAWDNLCLCLRAAGAFQTKLDATNMWEYPLLQGAIQFTDSNFVFDPMFAQSTLEDLHRADPWGRTPLIVAIERAGKSDNDPHDHDILQIESVIERLLDDDKGGSSHAASIPIADPTNNTNATPCLPLHRALHLGVGLEDGGQHIVKAFPGALAMKDPETNLLPCLLAAVGASARVNTIFGLMIKRPDLIVALCSLD